MESFCEGILVVNKSTVQSPPQNFQWTFEAERGPQCLFIKMHCDGAVGKTAEEPAISESIWKLLSQHLTYRAVIDINQLQHVPENIGQEFQSLQSRVRQHDGMLRFVGHSEAFENAMEMLSLDYQLFSSRENAMLGRAPK
jgi:anti-anti-sigma regulatory factor